MVPLSAFHMESNTAFAYTNLCLFSFKFSCPSKDETFLSYELWNIVKLNHKCTHLITPGFLCTLSSSRSCHSKASSLSKCSLFWGLRLVPPAIYGHKHPFFSSDTEVVKCRVQRKYSCGQYHSSFGEQPRLTFFSVVVLVVCTCKKKPCMVPNLFHKIGNHPQQIWRGNAEGEGGMFHLEIRLHNTRFVPLSFKRDSSDLCCCEVLNW